MTEPTSSSPSQSPSIVRSLVVLGILFLLLFGAVLWLLKMIMPTQGPIIRLNHSLRVGAVSQPLSAYQPAPPAVLAKGKQLFLKHCASCHGKEGHGDGPAGRALFPRPTPYVWGRLRYGGRFQDIFQTITRGSPNRRSAMAAWGWLPQTQREALAHYVRDLCARNARALHRAASPPSRPRPSPQRRP